MEEGLMSIMGGEDIDTLFQEAEETGEETPGTEEVQSGNTSEETEESDGTKATEVKGSLFEEEDIEPESVGSGNSEEGDEEGSSTENGGGTSPDNFYSSIATAMAEDGIFPNLDEETVTKADSAEALSDLIDQEVNARLDELQQRVAKALKNGVEPTEIRSYENALHFLNGVKDADLNDETEKGENLRYQIIMQDFLNKGYSKERADKLTRRSIDAGTDLDDAKEALQSNKEHFQKKYQDLLDEAEEKANAEKEKTRKQSEQLKNSLLKDKNLLGDMEISQDVRKKAFEVISRPVYKDPETGEYLTAVQRYEQEHPVEFIKYVGLVMAMTDNFKDFKSFYKGEVKKAERKGMRALEQTINGTRRNTDGSLRMVTRAKDDPESVIPSGFKLAL